MTMSVMELLLNYFISTKNVLISTYSQLGAQVKYQPSFQTTKDHFQHNANVY